VATKANLEAMRLPELWQKYEEAIGTKTRTPNKAFLVKAILDAEKDKRKTSRGAVKAESGRAKTTTTTASHSSERPRGRFAGMTVDELRALYEEKVGRPTDSTDEAYLKWKIREAEKGRVTVGPVQRRHRDEARKRCVNRVVAVTLRFGESELERLDRALERAGAKNRTRFLMTAIGKQLAALGETELAEAIAGAEVA